MLVLALASALAADPAPAAPPPAAGTVNRAAAALEARSGSKTTGTVTFQQEGGVVKVTIAVSGATPGAHAVHIHEKGDCSAPDAASAGGHFNPLKMNHGDPATMIHHPGDFGNLVVGADGKGQKEFATTAFTLAPSELGVAGLSVIVHEKPDDYSQPVGNAGPRQACGVIQLQ